MSLSALTLLAQNAPWHQPAKLTGLPFGYGPLVLHQLAQYHKKPLGLVLKDEKEIQVFEALAKAFCPDLAIVSLVPWDCVPYDRLSPRPEISSGRVKALATLQVLSTQNSIPWAFLTTPEGLIQKVPAPASFTAQTLAVSQGMRISVDALVNFCVSQGYRRVDTVYEPGDYALRGGIVDLFPPDMGQPIRLDMFGEEVESLRMFDPATQRSIESVQAINLGGVSEIPLTQGALDLFRQRFRQQFGIQALQNSRVQGVLAGRQLQGAEHWLPLMYDKMAPITAYLPKSLQWLTFMEDLESQGKAFLQEIEDNHRKRSFKAVDDEAPYFALEPDALYDRKEAFMAWIQGASFWQGLAWAYPTDAKKGYYNAGGALGYSFAAERAARAGQTTQGTLYDAVVDHIQEQQSLGRQVVLASTSNGRLLRLEDALKDAQSSLKFMPYQNLTGQDKAIIATALLPLEEGFVSDQLCCLTDADILGQAPAARPPKKSNKSPQELLSELSSLSAGDFVVHTAHGIGVYKGLQTLTIDGATHDFINIAYAEGDKLLVPIEHISAVTKYTGAEGSVALDRLGSAAWQARRAKVKKRLMEIADKLMKTAAIRQTERTAPWGLPEGMQGGMYGEFCAQFPYELTPDQTQAESDVLEDFDRGVPMDRLICGDVGFGKTELALRAAFLAVYHKKQVCVVVPTTLLCRQHFRTFATRFAAFGVRVAQLSRLVVPAESKKIKEACAQGEVSILIATHAAFGKGLHFKDLGLVVLDEEQHFGVVQKEVLKKKYPLVHILTLSATPIPRTLQLSLSGLRPMSLIATPPVDRLAVRTFVLPYDAMVIQEALLREYYRGGQSFYVCPRLRDLPVIQEQLTTLVPDLKIAQAHGQLKPAALEAIMQDFYEGKYDALLSTNIVESGIDIPTANTMIVHRADMFGLSQLYQLRGRVGRGKTRGYAYFTTSVGKTLTDTAKKRLKVMHSLDSLGAGFTIASQDMDIRGAGNLVGEAQAGQVKEVGVELYQQMLKDAVDEVKFKAMGGEAAASEPIGADFLPQIHLGIDAFIPDYYVEDLNLRLRLYKRLANCFDEAALPEIEEEFLDRFGALPLEVKHLFELITLKILASKAGVDKIEVGPKGAILSFYKNQGPDALALVNYITQRKGLLKLRPDHKLVFIKPLRDLEARYPEIKRLLMDIWHLKHPS